MRTDHAKAVRSLYAKSPLWLRAFARIRMAHAGYDVVEAVLPRKGRIIDVGCGYGFFAHYVALASPDREVIGVEDEFRKYNVADATERPNVNFDFDDALEWGFWSGVDENNPRQADGIAVLHVLHHLKSPAQQRELLARCVKFLAPDGVLAVLEVDTRPRWKFSLAWLVDHALYPGDGIFFRGRAGMHELLSSLGLTVLSQPIPGKPFPHILYVCRRAR